MHACLMTCMRLARRDPYADVLWMNLMTERTDAQRETVRLYQNNTLDGDSQAAQITLGKAINEYGQSTGSLQAQGGCMQPTHCSPHAWKQPAATAVMSGALSLPRLFCAALYGVFGIALLRAENRLPKGRLHDGVLTLPRSIHYQKAIDDFPVNDFGAHACLLHVAFPRGCQHSLALGHTCPNSASCAHRDVLQGVGGLQQCCGGLACGGRHCNHLHQEWQARMHGHHDCCVH